MEIETEVTINVKVQCPHCGGNFETDVTDTVSIEVEPEDVMGDPD